MYIFSGSDSSHLSNVDTGLLAMWLVVHMCLIFIFCFHFRRLRCVSKKRWSITLHVSKVRHTAVSQYCFIICSDFVFIFYPSMWWFWQPLQWTFEVWGLGIIGPGIMWGPFIGIRNHPCWTKYQWSSVNVSITEPRLLLSEPLMNCLGF